MVFRKPKPMRDIKGYLTEEQINKLFSAIKSPRDTALFKLLYNCGRRVSEVLKLKEDDIIWDEGVIVFNILKKKNPEKARIPANKETLDVLKAYIDRAKPKEYLFNITRQQVFNLIRDYGKEAGIKKVGEKKIHPHHLRHSFAVNWVKRGGELRTLQNILVHEDINTTAFYLQFGSKDIKEEYDKVWK